MSRKYFQKYHNVVILFVKEKKWGKNDKLFSYNLWDLIAEVHIWERESQSSLRRFQWSSQQLLNSHQLACRTKSRKMEILEVKFKNSQHKEIKDGQRPLF